MAYVVPPTFADTNALSASQLNTLSDDIEYLYGIAAGPQVAVNAVSGLGTASYYYAFRYAHDYLHIKYVIAGGSTGMDYIKLYIYDDNGAGEGWEQIYEDEPAAAATYTQAIDIANDDEMCTEGDTPGSQTGGAWNLSLTVGNWYMMRLDVANTDATSFIFAYIINADTTSL